MCGACGPAFGLAITIASLVLSVIFVMVMIFYNIPKLSDCTEVTHYFTTTERDYSVYDCYNGDKKNISDYQYVDNAIIKPESSDYYNTFLIWIVFDSFKIAASIVLLVARYMKEGSILIYGAFILPYIVFTTIVVAIDVIFMSIIAGRYSGRTSSIDRRYYGQMMGMSDSYLMPVLAEREEIHSANNISIDKLLLLHFRLMADLIHTWFTVCLILRYLKRVFSG